MNRISNAQIRKIFATAKELGLGNELLHTFIFNLVDSKHISALTSSQANRVIDELEYKKTGVRKQKDRIDMATDEQTYKIHALERDLGWDSNPKRLIGFMKKYCKVENIRWLTFSKASDLIEALKKLVEKN